MTRAMILLRRWRYINHVLTYLLTYTAGSGRPSLSHRKMQKPAEIQRTAC